MLIKITNKHDIEFLTNSEIIDALTNLLTACKEGNHFVFVDENISQAIIQCELNNFSKQIKEFVRLLPRMQKEYLNLVNKVCIYTVVDLSETKQEIYLEEINNEIFKIKCGFIHFTNTKNTQPINTILENIDDASFFRVIIDFYKRKTDLTSTGEIKWNLLNGGGSTTLNVFQNTIQEGKFVFVITDNDKCHPESKNGGTSQKIINYIETENSYCDSKSFMNYRCGFFKDLGVHEIENLIPFDTIKQVVIKNGNYDDKKNTFNFLETAMKRNPDVKFHFDHKKGANIKELLELDNRLKKIFWHHVIESLNLPIEFCGFEIKNKCDSSHMDCENIRIDGFGTDLLSTTMDYINSESIKKYVPIINESLETKWLDIGRFFFSITCAPRKFKGIS